MENIIMNNELTENELLFIKKENSKQYLKDTDWYYARKAETSEEVPEEVIAKRVEARELIRANEGVSE